jgi:hypothetical protein
VSKAPCTLSLFAITSGELFEIDAIAKERYRVETFPDAKKFCKGFPCDLHSKNVSEGDSGR